MTGFWMVRAGDGGRLFAEFERARCVAIGWNKLGDLSVIQSQPEMKEV
jgi:hypothetical protein